MGISISNGVSRNLWRGYHPVGGLGVLWVSHCCPNKLNVIKNQFISINTQLRNSVNFR